MGALEAGLGRRDPVTRHQFLQAQQSRTARIAVGASAARSNPKGTVAAARAHLRALDMRRMRSPSTFGAFLNAETRRLQRALPRRSSWGFARKALNIFFRDCLYNTYLTKRYDLSRFQAVLEIPLDSITAAAIRRSVGRRSLPKWGGVRGLTPRVSKQYQVAARQIARMAGTAAVHLDSIFWSLERDE